jgi:hypothetical protein
MLLLATIFLSGCATPDRDVAVKKLCYETCHNVNMSYDECVVDSITGSFSNYIEKEMCVCKCKLDVEVYRE